MGEALEYEIQEWTAGLAHEREMRRIALSAALKYTGAKAAAGNHPVVDLPDSVISTAQKFYEWINKEDLAGVHTEPDTC